MASKKKKNQQQKQNKKKKQMLTSKQPISKKRLWAFRVASMMLVPLILLACFELGLRIIGFGYPTQAIIRTKIDNPNVYHYNSKFGWRFFPKNISREFNAFAFDVHKTPQTYRIFVLGASAAAGVPDPLYNFGRFVEIMLADKYPQTKFEVVTVAMPAINSHAVLPAAKDCAKYDPDLFIVYLGNNEVVGPFGPGTVFAPMAPNLSVIRANIAAKATRTGQFLEQVLQSVTPRGKTPQTWGGMGMFLDNQVRYNDPALRYVYSHFEQNLKDIIKAGLKARANVIVSNVGSNLKDNPPFASLHRDGLTVSEKNAWETIYQEGVNDETDGQYTQAIQKYLAAAEIDKTFADLQFRLGRCYWLLGDYSKAKDRYSLAREYDTLRFRADTRINQIIQSVAEDRTSEGVYYVNTTKALEANSHHITPGHELFYEHVHYKFEGNYLVAKTLLDTIEKILPGTLKQQKRERPTLTLQQCKDRLAYTGFDEHKTAEYVLNSFIKQPPFTNQLYHVEGVKQLEEEVQSLKSYTEKPYLEKAVSQYRQQIREHPMDWKLLHKSGLVLLLGLEEADLAMNAFKEVLTFLPDDLSYSYILQILEKQEKFDEAASYYRRLLKLRPGYWSIYYDYAKVLGKKGNFEEATKYYRKSLKLYPMQSLNAYILLADSYNQLGKKKNAVSVIRKALELFPKDTPSDDLVLFPLLIELGQTQFAVDHYKQVLEVKPDLLLVLNNLAWILAAHPNEEIRDPANAIRYAQKSCELTEQKQAKILDTLAVAYASAGDFPKAITTTEKAAALAMQEDNNDLAERIQNRLRLYQSGKMFVDNGLK